MTTEHINILIVDDRPEGLITLEAVLGNVGHTLITATSGYEALERVRDFDFAAILLDVQMPGMDGFETAVRIREISRAKETPIIFVTAINKETCYIHRGYESGAVDYVVKPFDPYILKSKVNLLKDNYTKTAQIKKQAALLRRSEERLKAALAASHTGTYRWDFRSNSMEWDENLDHLLGLTPNEMPHDFDQFAMQIHPDDRSHVLIERERCATSGTDFAMEFRVVTPNGEVRWLADHGKTFFDDSNLPLYMTGACVDVTKFKETERTLANKVEELGRSNADLEQFAYVASHDLQEPLRNVTSYAQLIGSRYKGKLDGNAENYLGFLVDGALRMQMLIQDLLSYARVTKADFQMKAVNLEQVVGAVVKDLKSAGDVDVAVNELPTILADSLQMTQLFQNLISNALKFKSDRPPESKVACVRGEHEWQISVSDNGIGIEPEYLEKIFVIFQRLHSTSEYPGTGIGLAICKKIVQRHGGRIWVESTPGVGSTFHFTIPIPKVEGHVKATIRHVPPALADVGRN
jgi:PAS domain S-box-containing protein